MSVRSDFRSRKVYSVSEVNRLVAGMLADYFYDIWVRGEVSNLKHYPSGHLYFSLKDEGSQIQAVCFRSSAQLLKFRLEDGLEVICHGRLEVYQPTGKYQIVLDQIEPAGLGALQKAFEQLKRKLAKEGLFDDARKRPLPKLPRVLGIVTSPAGAAIHDMLKTLRLHKARLKVLLFPVQVQGEGAAEQIAEGITVLADRQDVDVIIVGRGGGSIEDLWPFNEEIVARAIAASKKPVVSGVGHETDFTIADFVADVRAATPTAAAQLVARGWTEAEERLEELVPRVRELVEERLLDMEQRLSELVRHRAFELVRARLAEQRHRLEIGVARAEAGLKAVLNGAASHWLELHNRLTAQNPVERLMRQKTRLVGLASGLQTGIGRQLSVVNSRLASAMGRLDGLSPLSSLKRGYSICQKRDGSVVTRIGQVTVGDDVRVRVSDGNLECEVRGFEKQDIGG
ncbi:MAG: exodeoxyribonuclease VII large subunit [candidate division WOR-3 bacterium]